MKTPDEIKCGLECIRTNVERICVKPEKGQCPRCEQLVGESLERIQQLEVELAAAERERDAAVAGLKKAATLGKVCVGCIHVDCEIGEMCQQNDFDCWNCRPGCVCKGCVNNSLWQWRGVCPENTEVQEDANAT